MLSQHKELGNIVLSDDEVKLYSEQCEAVLPFALLNGRVSDSEMDRLGVTKTAKQSIKGKEKSEKETRGHWINCEGTVRWRQSVEKEKEKEKTNKEEKKRQKEKAKEKKSIKMKQINLAKIQKQNNCQLCNCQYTAQDDATLWMGCSTCNGYWLCPECYVVAAVALETHENKAHVPSSPIIIPDIHPFGGPLV